MIDNGGAVEAARVALSGAGPIPNAVLYNNGKQLWDALLVSGVVELPVGAIVWFAGSSAPSGFLAADGSAVSRTTYSALFSVVGTTYGPGDGSTTFELPTISSTTGIYVVRF